jgi:hypothetical protein
MHLVTPVPKTCPLLSVHWAGVLLFCSWHDLTAVNSLQYVTNCQHTTARQITQLHWQFIRCSPSHSRCQTAKHNTSICPIPPHRHCSPTPRQFRKIPQHQHLHIRQSQTSLQHVQQSDIVEPTLRVTAHNLPHNSGTAYCVLKVTVCNTAQFVTTANVC